MCSPHRQYCRACFSDLCLPHRKISFSINGFVFHYVVTMQMGDIACGQVCCFGSSSYDELYSAYCDSGLVCNSSLSYPHYGFGDSIGKTIKTTTPLPICVPCGVSSGPSCQDSQNLAAGKKAIRPMSSLPN